jgi:alpha-N-arabinofuranosidase
MPQKPTLLNPAVPEPLTSSSDKVLATAEVASKSVADDWVQHEFVLTPKEKA